MIMIIFNYRNRIYRGLSNYRYIFFLYKFIYLIAYFKLYNLHIFYIIFSKHELRLGKKYIVIMKIDINRDQ